MCMLNRSLKTAAKVKNDLFSAKQNKFAKLNSTHGKGHQKKKKRLRKVTLIIKKKNNVAAKESKKKSRVTKVKSNEVCFCSSVVCTRHNFAGINLTVFNQNVSFS